MLWVKRTPLPDQEELSRLYKKLLVTGGCGFIGSNFVRFVFNSRPQCHVINLDALTYASFKDNLADIHDHPQYRFVHGDIRDRVLVDQLITECDAVVHFAAETHVDRSIMDPEPFVETNVLGTQTLLTAAHKNGKVRFLQVGTDEVYGQLALEDPKAGFTENDLLKPNNPYSATKAAGDLLARAFHHTHGVDTVITRCSNNFGPYQFPEKVIPLFVTNLLEDKKVPLYGDGRNVRDWLHVLDHCDAILTVLEKGKAGEIYNIGGNNERSNIELTSMIIEALGQSQDMIEHVKDRPGHDRRYAIDATKISQQLNWSPTRSTWPQALQNTVQWYVDHQDWCQSVKNRKFDQYYEKQYGEQHR